MPERKGPPDRPSMPPGAPDDHGMRRSPSTQLPATTPPSGMAALRRSATTLPRVVPPKPVDFALMTPASRIVEDLLAINWGEHFVVVHDQANVDIARALEEAAYDKKARVTRVDWDALASRPWRTCPPEVLGPLASAAASALVVRTEEGEYDARAQLIQAVVQARSRHVHIVGSTRNAISASVAASPSRVFEVSAAVKSLLRPTSKIVARSAAGTQLEIEMAPHLRWTENGEVVRPGLWINVPFGSLIASPHVVRGVYIADAAIGGAVGSKFGSLAGRPIRLVFENGRLSDYASSDPRARIAIQHFLQSAPDHDRAALVSLGTNIGLQSPLGEIVHDQNMPGLHLSLGETYPARTGATWTSHGQLSFAAASMDVDVDGAPIVRSGRFVRFV